MKLIFFLTFSISYFATSEADLSDIGYRLALGPLEFFLRLGINDTPNCYIEHKDKYEENLIHFSENIKELQKNIQGDYSISYKGRNYLFYAMNEAVEVSERLNNYPNELKTKIFNGNLEGGGSVVWNQRCKVEKHYSQYESHLHSFNQFNEGYYKKFAPVIQGLYDTVLKQSDEFIQQVLGCLEERIPKDKLHEEIYQMTATKSGADVSDIVYHLALGSLEFFLRLGTKNIPECYIQYREKYEESLIQFSEKIKELQKKTKSDYSLAATGSSYLLYALEEAVLVSNRLNNYPTELKAKIFNQDVKEGGSVVWNQRHELELHYSRYLTHLNNFKQSNGGYYNNFAPVINEIYDTVLKQSNEFINQVLVCLKSKGISFTGKSV